MINENEMFEILKCYNEGSSYVQIDELRQKFKLKPMKTKGKGEVAKSQLPDKKNVRFW